MSKLVLLVALCACASVVSAATINYDNAIPTATIRSAITAAASDTTFVFAGGVYTFTTTIVLSPAAPGRNNIAIEGSTDPSNPTIFKFTSGQWGLQVDRVTGLTVKNIHITTSGSVGFTKGTRGFKISQCNNVVLDHCEASGHFRAGIDLNTVNGGSVTNCHSHDNGGHGFSIADVQGVTFSNCKSNNNAWAGMSIANSGVASTVPTSGVVVTNDNDLCTSNPQGGLQLELNDGALNAKIATWNGQNVLGKQVPMTFTYFHSSLLNAVRPNDQNGQPIFGFGTADGFSTSADVDVQEEDLRFVVVRNAPSTGVATKGIRFYCAPLATDDTTLALLVTGSVDPVFLDGKEETFYVSPPALLLAAATGAVPAGHTVNYKFQCGAQLCDLPVTCSGDCAPVLTCPNLVAVQGSSATVALPQANVTAISPANLDVEITYKIPAGTVFEGTAFPLGVTSVTATATDTAGASSSCTFDVCVAVDVEETCYNNRFVTSTGTNLCLAF